MLSRTFLAATAAVILSIVLSGTVLAFSWQTGTVNGDAEAQLRSRVNAEHYRVCGRYLSSNGPLTWAARYKAQDMGYRGYFGHAYLDGKRTWNFYGRAGIPYSGGAGEILAWNTYPDYEAGKAAYYALMGSSTHRALIRSCRYTRFGVGAFKVTSGRHYFAVEFTRP